MNQIIKFKTSKNIEFAECENCGKQYPRRKEASKTHNSKINGLRRKGSMTCSHRCSVELCDEHKRIRILRAKMRRKQAIGGKNYG